MRERVNVEGTEVDFFFGEEKVNMEGTNTKRSKVSHKLLVVLDCFSCYVCLVTC